MNLKDKVIFILYVYIRILIFFMFFILFGRFFYMEVDLNSLLNFSEFEIKSIIFMPFIISVAALFIYINWRL